MFWWTSLLLVLWTTFWVLHYAVQWALGFFWIWFDREFEIYLTKRLLVCIDTLADIEEWDESDDSSQA